MDTRISFGTDGWRDTLDEFTTDRVKLVGQAVATYLNDHGLTDGPIAIGYDPREGSAGFAAALASVLVDNGIDVMTTETDVPTPALAWAIRENAMGGLMLTASHNPPEYNGVKFITAAGAPALPAVTDDLEERLAEPKTLPAAARASEESFDPRSEFIDTLLEFVDPPDLDDITIAYDAMHGSGRGVTDRALEQAGASVDAYRCTRDPTFGGTPPEPAARHLETIAGVVSRGEADLGLANDGDADRVAVITPEHGYVDEGVFFATLYEYLLEDESGPAVRSVPTTSLIDRVARSQGESVVQTPVGFKWIAAAMREHDALVGGEESGGFGVRGHLREKDGVLMALLAAAMTAEEPIDERIDRLLDKHGPLAQDKLSVDCPDERKEPLMDELAGDPPQHIAAEPVQEVATVDGLKLTVENDAWVLIRPSGTEPKMRVYAEAESDQRVQELLDAGRSLVEGAR